MMSAPPTTARDDLRGSVAMATGNIVLVFNDTLVKLAANHLPMSEVICLRAIAAMTLLLAVARLAHGPLPRPGKMLAVRAVLEAGASFAYLYALQLIPIGELVGLQQVVPLALLVGAALVFGERIGRPGWLAALVGLTGALLIIRPGLDNGGMGVADIGAALAALAVVFQVARDLLTRALRTNWPPAYVAGTSQIAMIACALCLAPFETWAMPSPTQAVEMAASALFLALANVALVMALRSGRLAVVGPFRYAGLLAALLSGYLVWGHLPDAISLLGSAVITASGLFSLWYSRQRQKATIATSA